MNPIILASTSPRRKEILDKSGLEFICAPSDYEEDMSLDMHPLELAKYLSNGKATALIDKYPNHIIIGADTFVTIDDQLLGKPITPDKAKAMLKQISGRTVDVITGFTIIDSSADKKRSKAITTKVYINNLTDVEIDAYIKTEEPLDKAGAFAIQGRGALIVKKIEGDYYNVMGFPLFDVSQELKKFGVTCL